ncbi:type II toxin-antitoxin system RelE/ParE family toxin [Persephonella sp.]
MSEILLLTDDKIFRIYMLKRVVKDIDSLKDKGSVKRIKSNIARLAERIPNKPEKWESIKGCKNLFELKVKPYRLACYVIETNILILHFWKVQKNISKQKRADIEKACEIAKEVKYEFEKLVRKR